MKRTVQITEAAKKPLEKYALGHIRETHYAAREAQDADEFNGPLVFGMAYWENLHRRFLQALSRSSGTPFVPLKISQGYRIPAVDHEEFGLIGLHHHRVKPPDYVPDGNSANALKNLATRDDGFFEHESREVSHRLVGIVGDPFGELEEVVIGKLEPVYPDSYRLAHKRKLDLGGWDGFDDDDDHGGPPTGPDPEPRIGPTVTREEAEEHTPA